MSPSCDHSLAARRRRLRMGQRKHLEPALMWRPGFLLGRRCGWKFRCDIKNTWRFCAHTKQRKYPPTNEVWCQVANAHSRLWYGSNYRSTQMMDFSLKIPWDITPCSFLCQGPFCGRTYLCVGITAASPKNSKKTQLHLKSILGNPSWCLEVSLRAMAESSTWLYAFAWLPIPIAGPVMFTATLYLNRLGSRVTDIVDKLLSFVLCACHIVFFVFFFESLCWYHVMQSLKTKKLSNPKTCQQLILPLFAVFFFLIGGLPSPTWGTECLLLVV